MAINWDNIGSGLLGAGLNYLSGQQDINAAKAAAAAAQGSDAKRKAAFDLEAAQLSALAPTIAEGYKMKPATATTAFARSRIDPTTGQVGYDLTPEAQGLFGGYMTGAQKSLELAKGMDPKAMAAERLAAQQELLAPQRAAEEANLMRKLQAKGIVGLGTHEGSTSGAQNPFAAALYGARSQADKRAAYESLTEGEQYLDRLINRSKGLFSGAKDVEGTGQQALAVGADWTNRFTGNEAARTKATTDLMKEAYAAQRAGAYDPVSEQRILNAMAERDQAKAWRTKGAIKGGGGMLDTVLKGAGGLSGVYGAVKDWFTPRTDMGYRDFGLVNDAGQWAGGSAQMGEMDLGGYDSMVSDWGTGADFGNFDYADYL